MNSAPEMNNLFLGIIALAVVVMAAIQVGALIYAARMARRVERLTTEIEREIRPIVADLRAITSDAARAVSVAAAQVDRAEQMLNEVGARVEQTMTFVQERILAPIRDGAALMAGLRAVLSAFNELRRPGRSRAAAVDEEDALFIG